MKIRKGFVTNSSSASFIVVKEFITEDEIEIFWESLDDENLSDDWEITETDEQISGWTVMDNGELYQVLKDHGFPMRYINIEGD